MLPSVLESKVKGMKTGLLKQHRFISCSCLDAPSNEPFEYVNPHVSFPSILTIQAPSSSHTHLPGRPVACRPWYSCDGSHTGHGLLPPLVDGGDGGHREPAFLCCAAGLGFPAHHAQVWGFLLLPVYRTRWVRIEAPAVADCAFFLIWCKLILLWFI